MKDHTTERSFLMSAVSVDTSVLEAARVLADRARLKERSEPVRVLESVRPKWPPVGR